MKQALAFVLLLAGGPVAAGPITGPSKPDPLLDGGPTVPCAADPEYAGALMTARKELNCRLIQRERFRPRIAAY